MLYMVNYIFDLIDENERRLDILLPLYFCVVGKSSYAAGLLSTDAPPRLTSLFLYHTPLVVISSPYE